MKKRQIQIEAPLVLPGDPPLPEPLAEGLAYHRVGRLRDAERVYTAFLRQAPEHPQALAFLGALAAEKGNLGMAIPLLRRAIQGNPRLADPRYSLCSVLRAQGNLAAAVTPGTYAMALGHPKAKVVLESILRRLGTAERALSANILTDFYLSTNQLGPALEHAQEAIRFAPTDYNSWALFSRCIARIQFTSAVEERLLDDIAHAFSIEDIDYRLIAAPALSALAHHEPIASLLAHVGTGNDPVTVARQDLLSGMFKDVCGHRLLNRLMRVVVVNDLRFERWLTAVREALLWSIFEAPEATEMHDECLSFITSLAIQAFLNEYVWMASQDEESAIKQLVPTIVARANRDEAVPPYLLAILAAYYPLYRLENAAALQTKVWPEALAELIKTQLVEPLEERVLQADIPTLLPISGNVAEAVRAQYEENPFPRWTTLPARLQQVSLGDYIAALFPSLRREERYQPSHPDILVAGCGTGLIPNHLARIIRNASITAVDLSRNSLGYARRKSRELGIESIRYIHGDLQQLGMLERQFDHINCFGVLHHMEDILRGWRSLNGCLKAHGTMQIGLYSEIARRPVVRIRQHIEKCGYEPTIRDMRRCRRDIVARQEDPLFKTIVGAMAFYSMSEFRDLVFHAQEHLVTLPEIDEMLNHLGLRFLGFQHGDASVAMRYRSQFPEDPEMRSLERWHQFELENPSTFGNCYNFWVWKPR